MNHHAGRISKLEQFRWYLLGGIIVVGRWLCRHRVPLAARG
jgi:hypothetical protein